MEFDQYCVVSVIQYVAWLLSHVCMSWCSAGGPTFAHAQELWHFLLSNESVLEGTFIKYIFQGKEVAELQGTPQKPVNCVLYKAKEHEGSLSSLCLNKVRMHVCVCSRPVQCLQWY